MTGTLTQKKLIKIQHASNHINKLLNSIDMLLKFEQRRERYYQLQRQLAEKSALLSFNLHNPLVAGLIRSDMREIKQELTELLEINITESEEK